MGSYYRFPEHEGLVIPAHLLPVAERILRDRDTAIQVHGYHSEIDEASNECVLVQVAEANRWGVFLDEREATIFPPGSEVKGGDRAEWLVPLAPLIREGGYVEVDNADTGRYRYMFHHGKCYRIFPTWIIGPDDRPEE